MKRTALVLALSLVAGQAAAQPRPDVTTMTCAAAQALVARSGAIVVTTGPATYSRIVGDVSFCTIEKSTRPDYERTRDVADCFVGYRCVDPFSEGRDGP
ncbi:hypothetical protein [Methylobacterium dankookense]|uniref:Uncharacterized protein n=1 Tax=Methylobacterium dankookense TaxID=560405 RepID=A0A564FU97_9HYPH|nr:hypothetical protein [Methylobacterium dankookense]GJD56362.1 hypothetical protein IFDJLNFL_2257 [Methylobacterium dankookense]VUF11715.1 hypothetical protein MTDSW087_01399 [Methylobacterium dankookense]